MKKGFTVFLALMILFITACCAGEGADRLTYTVYPLLPDPTYDQKLIERRWSAPNGTVMRTARMPQAFVIRVSYY